MTSEDRATSYCALRRRLFLLGYTNTLDADEETLRRALLALPHSVADLHPIVGADGMWAAMNILGRPDPPLTLEQAWHELRDALLEMFRPIVTPVLDWLERLLERLRWRGD